MWKHGESFRLFIISASLLLNSLEFFVWSVWELRLDIRIFHPGQTVLREGEFGEMTYILVHGEAFCVLNNVRRNSFVPLHTGGGCDRGDDYDRGTGWLTIEVSFTYGKRVGCCNMTHHTFCRDDFEQMSGQYADQNQST